MQPFAPNTSADLRGALGAIKAQGESERYWRINHYEGAFDGLNVEGLPGFWDTSVPLRERSPAIRAQLPKIAARRLVAMLFSDRAFPSVTVDASAYGVSLDAAQAEALGELVSEVVRVAKIPSVMRAVTMAALRSGTTVAVTGIRRGRPVVDLLPAKCCTPTFDADGVLTRVEYMQKVPAGGDKWVMHRRVITAQTDTVFKPVDVAKLTEHTDLDALPSEPPRPLQFLPVVWIRNASDSTCAEIDGYPIHHGLLAEINAADMECSQLQRTALYNGEPVMVKIGTTDGGGSAPMGPAGRTAAGAVGPEAEHGPAAWGSAVGGFFRGVFKGGAGGSATKKAPNIVWNLPQGGDVKMLESTGAGAQILTTAFATHSRIVTDAMGVILAQPGDIGGNAMSSKSLALMFAPMLATVDEMRVAYGEVLCEIVAQLLRWCHVTARGVYLSRLDAARPALAAMSADVDGGIDEKTGKPVALPNQWMGTALTLQWGEFFEPSWQDISAAVDAATKITGGARVASQRAAMRLVSQVIGVDDLDAEAEEIERETGGADAAMRETLAAMSPVEASPAAPAAPGVPGADAVADTALNSAQVAALTSLAKDVTARLMAPEAAVQIAVLAFRIDEARARSIIEPAAAFTAAAPPAPPAPPAPVTDGPPSLE